MRGALGEGEQAEEDCPWQIRPPWASRQAWGRQQDRQALGGQNLTAGLDPRAFQSHLFISDPRGEGPGASPCSWSQAHPCPQSEPALGAGGSWGWNHTGQDVGCACLPEVSSPAGCDATTCSVLLQPQHYTEHFARLFVIEVLSAPAIAGRWLAVPI